MTPERLQAGHFQHNRRKADMTYFRFHKAPNSASLKPAAAHLGGIGDRSTFQDTEMDAEFKPVGHLSLDWRNSFPRMDIVRARHHHHAGAIETGRSAHHGAGLLQSLY